MACDRTNQLRIFLWVCLSTIVAAAIGWLGWIAANREGSSKISIPISSHKTKSQTKPQASTPPRPSQKSGQTKEEPSLLAQGIPKAADAPNESSAVLAEEKTKKLKMLIQGLRDYQRLYNAVYDENPQLREIPELLRWLAAMPAKEFAKERAELAEMEKSEPEKKQQLYSLMRLNGPAVIMAMLDDPKFGTWMTDIFEVAGLKNKISQELEIADYGAGYKGGDSKEAALSIDALRASLERRLPVYDEAAQAKAAEWGISLSERQKEAMFAAVQKDIMTEYLKLYYDSFFGGDIATKAAQLREEEAQYYAFAKSISVPSEVWDEFKIVRETTRISPMTTIKPSTTKSKQTP